MYTIFNSKNFNKDFQYLKNINNNIYYDTNKDTIILKTQMMNITDFNSDFISNIFNKYPQYNKIKFDKLIIENNTIKSTIFNAYHLICNVNEISNNLLKLPLSLEDYLKSLGKKTRQHLKWYQRQIEKDFSNYVYVIENNENCKIQTLNEIMCLLHKRRKNRGLEVYSDLKEFFPNFDGYIVNCYLTINGKIVAGTISTVFNGALNLHYITHDDNYSSYNIGNLILLKTIEYAISQKIKIFNLLWGNLEYKKRFGCVEQKLYDLTIYKNKKEYLIKKNKKIIKNFIFTIKNLIKSWNKKVYIVLRFIYQHSIKKYFQPIGYIFSVSRCEDFADAHLLQTEKNKVTPNYLDEQISILKEKYDIISLKDISFRINKKINKRFIAFTFDEGYKDILTNALPIFKKHDIPFTVFININFPDKNELLWEYEVEELLMKNDSITLSNGISYPSYTFREKCDSFNSIANVIENLNSQNLEKDLNVLFSNYNINWKKKCENLCLSYEDIKQLSKEGLVSFGITINEINSQNVLEEIIYIKNKIEQNTGIKIRYLSTKNCNIRKKLIKKLTFESSFYINENGVVKKNLKDRCMIPIKTFKHGFNEKDLK